MSRVFIEDTKMLGLMQELEAVSTAELFVAKADDLVEAKRHTGEGRARGYGWGQLAAKDVRNDWNSMMQQWDERYGKTLRGMYTLRQRVERTENEMVQTIIHDHAGPGFMALFTRFRWSDPESPCEVFSAAVYQALIFCGLERAAAKDLIGGAIGRANKVTFPGETLGIGAIGVRRVNSLLDNQGGKKGRYH